MPPAIPRGMDNPAQAIGRFSAMPTSSSQLKVRQAAGRHHARRHLRHVAGGSLDCGCGTATFLRILHAHAYHGLAGCDISQGMLDEAARTWPGRRTAAPGGTIQE